MSTQVELPVRQVLPELIDKLLLGNSVILRAPPGAGKTTLVPLELLHHPEFKGRVILTQPRRLAARTAAARLSTLNETELGRAIGYQVRMERCWGNDSRLIAMTTGVLLRRLISDPFLENFSVVVLDEFHERSLELDLALGMLVRLQQTVRPDLKIVVMSATFECGPIASYLGNAPILESQGRVFEVDVRYARQVSRDPIEQQIAGVLANALAATPGHLLVFLPGVGEIFRVARAIESIAEKAGCRIWQLFGDMPSAEQDLVLANSRQRKIILATNVAETSLTIDGVTGVIDSGQVRVMRFDPAVGLSRLVLEANSMASAEQRAGRAGRQAPGVCFRIWPEAMNRSKPAFDTPEILRGDLTGALLQLAGLGETDFEAFPWLTSPSRDALATAQFMLQLIGALAAQKITEHGRQLLQIPAAPRLAKLLVASREYGVPDRGALAAALLSERDPFRVSRFAQKTGNRRPADRNISRGHSDLVEKVTRLETVLSGGADPDLNRGALQQIVKSADYLSTSLSTTEPTDESKSERRISQLAGNAFGRNDPKYFNDQDTALRAAIWAAYPDRLARRRQPGSDRGLMVGGIGVRLAPTSSVIDAELFVCVDVEQRDRDSEVRMASAVESEWLPEEQLRMVDEYFFHPTQKNVQARRRRYWLDLVIAESAIAATDASAISRILYEQAVMNWPQAFPLNDPAIDSFLARVACLREWMPETQWPEIKIEDLHEIARQLCRDRKSLADLKQAPWLDYLQTLITYEQRRQLDALAPREWLAPSGNQTSILYEPGRPPKLSIRLQELFGLPETPRIAGGRIPLLLELLGPNYRPQQLTNDLASFWKNTYPVVRKELLRRYPKHHWPDDPLHTIATRSGLKRDAK